MIEAIELMGKLMLRTWQLWGAMAFIGLPIGFVLVAAWDFADWHKERRRRK